MPEREHTEKKVEIEVSIYPPATLFMRHDVGEAKLTEDAGVSYEMTANVADLSPIVRSRKTGKWAAVPWQSIIAAAVAAGIDEE